MAVGCPPSERDSRGQPGASGLLEILATGIGVSYGAQKGLRLLDLEGQQPCSGAPRKVLRHFLFLSLLQLWQTAVTANHKTRSTGVPAGVCRRLSLLSSSSSPGPQNGLQGQESGWSLLAGSLATPSSRALRCVY